MPYTVVARLIPAQSGPCALYSSGSSRQPPSKGNALPMTSQFKAGSRQVTSFYVKKCSWELTTLYSGVFTLCCISTENTVCFINVHYGSSNQTRTDGYRHAIRIVTQSRIWMDMADVRTQGRKAIWVLLISMCFMDVKHLISASSGGAHPNQKSNGLPIW